jgi:hypothetical protein
MFMHRIQTSFTQSFPGMVRPSAFLYKDTHDGLRGFEIQDPDGYVLFFGRPR